MTRHPSFPVSLGVDWNGGTSYTTIGQVRDLSGPEPSRNEIEVPPDHDLSDNYQKYFPGVSQAGEMSFPINLDPSHDPHVGGSKTGLLGSFEDVYNGTALPSWQYQNTGMHGGTATWTADGFVTGFPFTMGNVEGHMEAEVTIRISGKPTLTIT